MAILTSPTLEQASIYSDLSSLDSIRRQGKKDEIGAIKQAAKEFESFFMNMMIKSMRQASEVIAKDSPFSSQQEKMFIGMMDEQLSVNLSHAGHLKIADIMVAQLTRQQQPVKDSEDFLVHREKIRAVDSSKSSASVSATLNVERQILNASNNISAAIVDESTPSVQFSGNAGLSGGGVGVALNNNALASEPTQQKVEKIGSKPSKRALFSQITDFVKTLLPHAKKAAQELGVDPKLLVAQAALETGWGRFVMHDAEGNPGFNFFGIKSGKNWSGDSIQIDTVEVEQQEFTKVNASFRKYQNAAESFQDYVKFVRTQARYQSAVKAAPNAENYLHELQNSGYATDPAYAEKILRIYEDQRLQDFEYHAD